MTIQEEANKIISQFGNSEMAHYKIQLMCDREAEKAKHQSINEQVSILKETLEEMMTGFDSDEDRMDFILDICNGYRKRITNKQN